MFLQIIHPLIYSPRRQVKYIILISLILILSACSMPKVHKIIIQQGNIVNQEMVDQLKPGMTKTQVAYIMGEPILKNTFEFYTVNGNEKIEHMVITVTGWNVNDGSCRRIGVRTFFCFVWMWLSSILCGILSLLSKPHLTIFFFIAYT